MAQAARRRIAIVTGLSGAGISTTLRAFEDLGYEAVDNLPLSLIFDLVDTSPSASRPIAIAIDTRARGFDAAALAGMMGQLRRRQDSAPQLIFVDCDPEQLQRRYTETRRRHPLASDRPVADGIGLELEMTAPLRQAADIVLDTSRLTLHDLRTMVRERFSVEPGAGLLVNVQSFSFKHGLPREADLVFDVRFLKNPYWNPELRALTGQHPKVQAAIRADPAHDPFVDRLADLLTPLLPLYSHEGKSYLTIAIGCTGGRHRSVHTAEFLASWIGDLGYRYTLRHRELLAAGPGQAAAQASDGGSHPAGAR